MDDVKKEVNQHSSASSGADGRTLGDASYAAVAGGVGESAVAGSPKVAVRESATPHYSDSTRKFNLVLFNIPESKLGRLSLSTCLRTWRKWCQPAPLQSLLTLSATFSGWVNSRRSSEGIVPKFIRCKDARAVLSGSSGLAPPAYIKQDLPLEVRKRESVLMKVRWDLIKQGVHKAAIKIHNNWIKFCMAGLTVLSASLELRPLMDLLPTKKMLA